MELNKIDLENKREIYNERSKKYYHNHKEHCKECHNKWLELYMSVESINASSNDKIK